MVDRCLGVLQAVAGKSHRYYSRSGEVTVRCELANPGYRSGAGRLREQTFKRSQHSVGFQNLLIGNGLYFAAGFVARHAQCLGGGNMQ